MYVSLTFFVVIVANNYKVISEPGHLVRLRCSCTLQSNLELRGTG